MTRTTSILALLAIAAGVESVSAQWNVARAGDSGANRIYMSFGLDPAFIANVGYALTTNLAGRPMVLSAEAGAVTAGFDLGDFRARVNGMASVVSWRAVHFVGKASFITRGTNNSIYRGINLGAELGCGIGLYRPGWFLAVESGYDKSVVTHVSHTDWYRQYFFPSVQDGWYLDAGGTIHTGMASGVTFGRTELMFRTGLLKTEEFNEIIPPFYGSLSVGLAW